MNNDSSADSSNSSTNSSASSAFGLFGLTMLPEIGSVHFKPEMDSTNTEALEIGKVAPDEWPILILTENQTAGRGRDDNQWKSGQGSLTFTLALNRKSGPEISPTLLSIAAGLSVHDALLELAGNVPVKLKWPNDVFVGEKKIAGVLIESNKKVTLVGIGINVNTPDLPKSATNLSGEAKAEFDLQSVLITVITNFFRVLKLAQSSPNDLVQSCQSKMLHFQKTISIFTDNQTVTGINTGLGESGELLVQSETSELKIVSGKNLKLL